MSASDTWILIAIIGTLLVLVQLGTHFLDRLDRPRRRFGRGPLRRTSDARSEERACFVGTLHPALNEPSYESWIDDRQVLVRETFMMSHNRGSEEHDPWDEVVVQQSRPRLLMLADGHGKLPVLFEDQEVWNDLPTRRVKGLGMERIDAFLASCQRTCVFQ